MAVRGAPTSRRGHNVRAHARLDEGRDAEPERRDRRFGGEVDDRLARTAGEPRASRRGGRAFLARRHQEDHAGAEMSTTTTDTGVRFSRLMRNAVPPPDYAKRYGYAGRIDRWEEFEYVAPATVLQSTGAVDVGKYDKGIRTGGHSLRAIHTFAPETAQSCFYFFPCLTAIANDNARVQMSRFLERKILEEQNDLLAVSR